MKLFGDITKLNCNLTIGIDGTITVPGGGTFSIAKGWKVINKGAIANEGTIYNEGTVDNNGTIYGSGNVYSDTVITDVTTLPLSQAPRGDSGNYAEDGTGGGGCNAGAGMGMLLLLAGLRALRIRV